MVKVKTDCSKAVKATEKKTKQVIYYRISAVDNIDNIVEYFFPDEVPEWAYEQFSKELTGDKKFTDESFSKFLNVLACTEFKKGYESYRSSLHALMEHCGMTEIYWENKTELEVSTVPFE